MGATTCTEPDVLHPLTTSFSAMCSSAAPGANHTTSPAAARSTARGAVQTGEPVIPSAPRRPVWSRIKGRLMVDPGVVNTIAQAIWFLILASRERRSRLISSLVKVRLIWPDRFSEVLHPSARTRLGQFSTPKSQHCSQHSTRMLVPVVDDGSTSLLTDLTCHYRYIEKDSPSR